MRGKTNDMDSDIDESKKKLALWKEALSEREYLAEQLTKKQE